MEQKGVPLLIGSVITINGLQMADMGESRLWSAILVPWFTNGTVGVDSLNFGNLVPCSWIILQLLAYKLPVCPDATTEVIPEISACFDMTTEFIYELPVCPEMTPEVDLEHPAGPIMTMEDTLELPACSDMAPEHNPKLSVLNVSVLSDQLWWSPVPPDLPWRSSAPLWLSSAPP